MLKADAQFATINLAYDLAQPQGQLLLECEEAGDVPAQFSPYRLRLPPLQGQLPHVWLGLLDNIKLRIQLSRRALCSDQGFDHDGQISWHFEPVLP